MTIEAPLPQIENSRKIIDFPTRTAVLVEKSPEELKRSKMAQLAALIRHNKITAEHIIGETREINYSLLGEEFRSGGKYDDLRMHLEAKQHKFSPRSKLMKTVKELHASVLSPVPEVLDVSVADESGEIIIEEPQNATEVLDVAGDNEDTVPESVINEVPVRLEDSELPEEVEDNGEIATPVSPQTATDETAITGVPIILKDPEITKLEAEITGFTTTADEDIVVNVAEWRKIGRCYPGRQASRLQEVVEMGLQVRKENPNQGRLFQGRHRTLRWWSPAFVLPLLAVGTTLLHAAIDHYQNQDLNSAVRSGTNESALVIISDSPPAPVLDVVLPASAAEPVNPEPQAKVEPPADVLKEIPVEGSIAQTLLDQDIPVVWQPGHPLFENTMARFEQLGDDNFLKLSEFYKNMGGGYFPASKDEFHILAKQARKDADARKRFYGLFDYYGAYSTLVIRVPAQNNTAANSAETPN